MDGCHRTPGAWASPKRSACPWLSRSATSSTSSAASANLSCEPSSFGGTLVTRHCPSSRAWPRLGCASREGLAKRWRGYGTGMTARWGVEMVAPAAPYPILADPAEGGRLWQEYGTIRGVARAVGCHPVVARKWLERAGVFASDQRLPSRPKSEGADRPTSPHESEDAAADRLVQLLRRQPHTVEQLADALDRGPARVRAMVEELRAQGYAITETPYGALEIDRKSTRLNSSHVKIS